MSLVHSAHPCEALANRLASLVETTRDSKIGLAAGFGLSALAGAPMPLPQLALAGPIVGTLAAGAVGGRAAAAVGFVSYLLIDRPSAAMAVAAAAVAVLVGWAVPQLMLRGKAGGTPSGTSAVTVSCDGFASLDESYGAGAGDHVFSLLRRALETETRDGDVVVHAQERELILVLDGSNPKVAEHVMTRVERRFSTWLADAGYDCDLSVGLAGSVSSEIDALLRASRRSQSGPYLD